MSDDDGRPGPDSRDPVGRAPEQRLREGVSRQADRMRRARERGRPSVFFSLGMMGMIGWSVALPTLLGAALGAWIDHEWPSDFSWTLALLLAGVTLGCANAWRWVQQEGRHRE